MLHNSMAVLCFTAQQSQSDTSRSAAAGALVSRVACADRSSYAVSAVSVGAYLQQACVSFAVTLSKHVACISCFFSRLSTLVFRMCLLIWSPGGAARLSLIELWAAATLTISC